MYTILGNVNFNDGFRYKRDAIAEAKDWVVTGEESMAKVRNEKTDTDIYVCWSEGDEVFESTDPDVIARIRT